MTSFRLSTRLLWPLLIVIGVVMLAYGVYTARQRERQLLSDVRRETNAYATALAIALEYAIDDGNPQDLTRILSRISDEPRIYGVVIYDSEGKAIEAATPLTEADALDSASVREFLADTLKGAIDRTLHGERFHSVFRPLRGGSRRVVGGLEVVQPLAPIFGEVDRTRQRVVIATLILLLAVAAVALGLVARVITRPLHRLVAGARALGRGELNYRIAEGGATELAELSSEFNRMAGHLQAAQTTLLSQAEERVVLERRLRNAEKLAALGNLAAGLAHEIAAPLNVVAGRAEMLRRGDRSRDTHDRDLRIIIDQIGRITVIMRNLLDFARRREPHLEPLQVKALIGGVVELLDAELERAGVRFSTDVADGLMVRGDPQLLHQVLLNLLMNAIQSLEPLEDQGEIEVRAYRPSAAGMVAIDVQDNGIGIPDENQSSLFEPFFTTKLPGQGTGLGLAVVKSIVEEHGGTIEALPGQRAGERRGALFRVWLPEPGDDDA